MAEMKQFNANVITEFRANEGKVGGMFANSPLLLLTTTGAKSGQPRTMPLVYTKDGDHLVIVASKGGSPTHPDWYLNLVKHPDATVELGTEKFKVYAKITEGAERERLFNQQAALMPNFAEYQKATTRQIPVVVLKRAG